MNKIKRIRVATLGLTSTRLAEVAGVSPTTVWRWECGAVEPTLLHLQRIRDFAIGAGVEWCDALFFDPLAGVHDCSPLSADEAGTMPAIQCPGLVNNMSNPEQDEAELAHLLLSLVLAGRHAAQDLDRTTVTSTIAP